MVNLLTDYVIAANSDLNRVVAEARRRQQQQAAGGGGAEQQGVPQDDAGRLSSGGSGGSGGSGCSSRSSGSGGGASAQVQYGGQLMAQLSAAVAGLRLEQQQQNQRHDRESVATEPSAPSCPSSDSGAAGQHPATLVTDSTTRSTRSDAEPEPEQEEDQGQEPGPQLPVSFRELRVAGCSAISAAALTRLAGTGALAALVTLDLAQLECYRLPAGPRPTGRWTQASSGACALPEQELSSHSSSGGGSELRQQQPGPMAQLLAAAAPRRLRSLALDGCFLDDATACGITRHCRHLTSLSLVGCKGLADAGLQALLGRCTGLAELSIGGQSSLWREDVALSAAGLGSLRSLSLCRRNVKDAQLAPLLRACTRLQRLCLAACHELTDAALLAVAAEALEQLEVSVCDGIEGSTLSRLRNLRRLRLSHVPAVSAEALRGAATACGRLALLEIPQHLRGCALLPQQAPGGHLQGLKVVDAL